MNFRGWTHSSRWRAASCALSGASCEEGYLGLPRLLTGTPAITMPGLPQGPYTGERTTERKKEKRGKIN
jgi:hypothetical protein